MKKNKAGKGNKKVLGKGLQEIHKLVKGWRGSGMTSRF